MPAVRSVRRRLGVVVIALVAAGAVGCGPEGDSGPVADVTTDDHTTTETAERAAAEGADWIVGELSRGVLYNDQFQADDYSTTVEAAYALMSVGADQSVIDDISRGLARGVEEYTSPAKDLYAGSTAKLAALAGDTGGDPRDFGGVDLVAQLENLTSDRGPAAGRIRDVSEYGDYANTFGQAWAVRALTNADSGEAAAARKFLLLQQCEAGFFRLEFSDPGAKDQSCDAAGTDEPPVDTAALVVVLLHDLADSDPDLAGALESAVAWMLEQQAEDGSFEGGSEVAGPNSNSTGLAGWALRLAGEDEAAAAAASWVRSHQVDGCGGELADESGAIAFDDAALATAAEKGITVKTRYQWRLATVQALPALLATPEGAEGAPCDSTG